MQVHDLWSESSGRNDDNVFAFVVVVVSLCTRKNHMDGVHGSLLRALTAKIVCLLLLPSKCGVKFWRSIRETGAPSQNAHELTHLILNSQVPAIECNDWRNELTH